MIQSNILPILPNTQNTLISTSHEFQFRGLNCIELAYNNSFIIYPPPHTNEQVLTHVDISGKQIGRLQFNSYFRIDFTMLSSTILIGLVKKQDNDYLIRWDLQNYSVQQHQLSYNYSSNVKIFVFRDTSMICLAQPQLKHKKYHLHYYLCSKIISPVRNYTFSTLEYSNTYIIKLNQTSKLALLSSDYVADQKIKIKTFQINIETKQGKQNQLYLNHLHSHQTKIKILDIWQLTPQVLYIQLKLQILKMKIINYYWYPQINAIIQSQYKFPSFHKLLFVNNNKIKSFSLFQINRIRQLFNFGKICYIYFVEWPNYNIVGVLQIKDILNNYIINQTAILGYQLNHADRMFKISKCRIPQFWPNNNIATVFMLQNLAATEGDVHLDQDLLFNITNLLAQNKIQSTKITKYIP